LLGISENDMRERDREKERRANGKIIPFMNGIAMTRDGHRGLSWRVGGNPEIRNSCNLA
jgi:hypothetical protein